MKKTQKLDSNQFYKGMPLWMQSVIKWVDHQMKACPPPGRKAWVRKDDDVHPSRGSGLTKMVRIHIPRIWFLILEHQV
jgi:hypothetical protein